MKEYLTTYLTPYYFDLRDPKHAVEYPMFCERLRSTPGRGPCLNVICSPKEKSIPEGEYLLDCTHVFGNQWNTAETEDDKGYRVFDWFEEYRPQSSIRCGHWLLITPEMVAIREATWACGYCGKQVREKKTEFCTSCFGSEYLTPNDLPLLRLKQVSDTSERPDLTETERGGLMEFYLDAQLKLASETQAKKRVEVREKYKVNIAKAEAERDGFLYLLDKGVSVENVIYYRHSNTFGIGWRKPLSEEEILRLEPLLRGFPAQYEIKRASEEVA